MTVGGKVHVWYQGHLNLLHTRRSLWRPWVVTALIQAHLSAKGNSNWWPLDTNHSLPSLPEIGLVCRIGNILSNVSAQIESSSIKLLQPACATRVSTTSHALHDLLTLLHLSLQARIVNSWTIGGNAMVTIWRTMITR